MSWGTRILLGAFCTLTLLSPAAVASCINSGDSDAPNPGTSYTTVPWDTEAWGGSWGVRPANCAACHG